MAETILSNVMRVGRVGLTNTANAVSMLTGSATGPSRRIDNNSTDANATALDLRVEPGKPR